MKITFKEIFLSILIPFIIASLVTGVLGFVVVKTINYYQTGEDTTTVCSYYGKFLTDKMGVDCE